MFPFYILCWVLHVNMYVFVFVCLDVCVKCMYVRRGLCVIA